jgi:superfamily I DNA and/or RNA helicase
LCVGDLPAWPQSVLEMSTFEEQLKRWRRIANALTSSCFDHVLQFLEPDQIVRLNIQRRMVPDIAKLVSEPVYNGDYHSTEIQEQQVVALTTGTFEKSWVFFNTSVYCARPESSGPGAARKNFRQDQQGTGFINTGEAFAVVYTLEDYAEWIRRKGSGANGKRGSDFPTMMVITYYLAQAKLIDSLVTKSEKLREYKVTVLPIDRCQGQQADIVVVSFVRSQKSKPRPNTGRWLQDPRRLTVALTRACRSLILIGNLDTLAGLEGDREGEKIFAHLAKLVRGPGGRQISMLTEFL